MRPILGEVQRAVSKLHDEHRLRDRHQRCAESVRGPYVSIAEREYVNFASNDYLGLAKHPAVIDAAREALERSGASSSASRLVIGNREEHDELEAELANLVGMEDALLFSSGYLANLGTLQAFGAALDRWLRVAAAPAVLLSDERNHASLIDGCRLARGEVQVYRHSDANDVECRLKNAHGRRKIVVTEARFSMDGDTAPLIDLAALCKKHGAMFIVDEAHSIGIDGEGRGLVFERDLSNDVDLVIGTLGKALGAHGAFVAGKRELVRWLENSARSFLFSTALPAIIASAALAAVHVLQSERPYGQLRANIALSQSELRAAIGGLGVLRPCSGPIVPIILGDARKTTGVGKHLESRGLVTGVIRPPTVPPGTSRIRASIRADHEPKHLRLLAEALAEALERENSM